MLEHTKEALLAAIDEGWEEAMIAYLPSLRLEQSPAIEDWFGGESLDLDDESLCVDVHNAREADWARGRPIEAVLRRLDTAHERIRKLAVALSDTDLAQQEIWDAMTGNTVKHYRDHLCDLAEAAG